MSSNLGFWTPDLGHGSKRISYVDPDQLPFTEDPFTPEGSPCLKQGTGSAAPFEPSKQETNEYTFVGSRTLDVKPLDRAQNHFFQKVARLVEEILQLSRANQLKTGAVHKERCMLLLYRVAESGMYNMAFNAVYTAAACACLVFKAHCYWVPPEDFVFVSEFITENLAEQGSEYKKDLYVETERCMLEAIEFWVDKHVTTWEILHQVGFLALNDEKTRIAAILANVCSNTDRSITFWRMLKFPAEFAVTIYEHATKKRVDADTLARLGIASRHSRSMVHAAAAVHSVPQRTPKQTNKRRKRSATGEFTSTEQEAFAYAWSLARNDYNNKRARESGWS